MALYRDLGDKASNPVALLAHCAVCVDFVAFASQTYLLLFPLYTDDHAAQTLRAGYPLSLAGEVVVPSYAPKNRSILLIDSRIRARAERVSVIALGLGFDI